MANPPYLLVPQSNPGFFNGRFQRSLPTFPPTAYPSVTSSSSNAIAGPSSQQPSASQPSTAQPTSTFKAPAHRHAHHLHSIPPREKSTRTLIIDHILWVHARTRFAQARAELGMTDRTGGPTSPNYHHRERPENFDEDEEAESDGEDVEILRNPVSSNAVGAGPLGLAFGISEPRKPRDEEVERKLRQEKQDLSLAKSLKLRSEGLEKTVTSMLDQPPPVHLFPDDFITPRQERGRNPHPHTLPNGVRLRLALATLYNDLFFRSQAPLPAVNATPDELPCILNSLAAISSGSLLSAERSGVTGSWSQRQSTNATQSPSISDINPRTISLYAQGARPRINSTTYSYRPPTARCNRHFYTSCPICLELTTRPATTRFGFAPGLSCSLVRAEWKGKYRVNSAGGTSTPGCEKEESLAEVVVRFIRLSALVARELQREVGHIGMDEEDSGDEGEEGDGHGEQANPNANARSGQSGSSSVPVDTISAARGSYASSPFAASQAFANPFAAEVQNKLPSSASSSASQPHLSALQPTREWYMLLVGLLTRAVLEGYLVGGWESVNAVQCLFRVGFGFGSGSGFGNDRDEKTGGQEKAEDELDEESMQFDPDDLPDVVDAARVLFPFLKVRAVHGLAKAEPEGAEREFETEMEDRRRRFLDIPASTSDLATHLEDLARRYPVEPIERAALRFYEAIAKWRGKPELETYKKRPPRTWTTTDASPRSMMESFLRSNPTSPASVETVKSRKQPIEKYFTLPSPLPSRARKRGRSRSPVEDSNGGLGKRGRTDGFALSSFDA